LYSTVTALLLAQQGRFALHATAVRIGAVDVAIAGACGIGKSTTALTLAGRGHRLLCDDVLPLEPEPSGTRHVPTPRPVRIAPSAAQTLGIDVSRASGPSPHVGKLALPCEPAQPSRLDAIVILRSGPSALIEISRIGRSAALPLLYAHAYRSRLLASWRAEIFRWAAGVAATVPVLCLERPAAGWSAGQVASALEDVAAQLLRARGTGKGEGLALAVRQAQR
jgi:hypothetical protein